LEQEFLQDVVSRLEKAALTYAITGSIASNLWGTPRTTHDVDIVIVLSTADIPSILALFANRYYVSEEAVREAIAQNSMFNVIDFNTSLKADLWVTSRDPFNESMLNRRRRLEIVQGQEAWIGSPEDVLLHKLVWHKITPSERQLADAAGIFAVQVGGLDVNYMRDWAAKQGTAGLLEEILAGKHRKTT